VATGRRVEPECGGKSESDEKSLDRYRGSAVQDVVAGEGRLERFFSGCMAVFKPGGGPIEVNGPKMAFAEGRSERSRIFLSRPREERGVVAVPGARHGRSDCPCLRSRNAGARGGSRTFLCCGQVGVDPETRNHQRELLSREEIVN
jgi:hypothetical protein